MITEVTRYQTSDGKLYETKETAEEHDLDRVRELFSDRLTPLLKQNKMRNVDRFNTVMAFLPDYESAMSLLGKMNRIL